MVDLKAKVVAYGGDHTIIELKPGAGAPTLKEVLVLVLREVHQELDMKQGHEEKTARYQLEKKLAPEDFGFLTPADSIELTPSEVAMLKERVGRFFFQGGVVGRVCELLDGQ